MKKNLLAKLMLLACVFPLSACNFTYKYIIAPYPFDDTYPDDDDDGGKYDIKVWCDERILDNTKNLIDRFERANQGKYTINLKVEAESEGDAATDMLMDVGVGADIYCFAQDQLSRLKIAGALAPITGNAAATVRRENSKGACAAASFNDTLYAFPMTSDNGYFMYYDKAVVSDEDAKDMDKIIDAVKKAGKRINYNVFSNGFYSASYFMATGCYSKWSIDNDTGAFTGYDDNYSQKAYPALKALRTLKASGLVVANDQTNKLASTAAVVISGIWNYQNAVEAIGNRLGCAEMPSFTVDGQTYHISSFSGYKLIGFKPQRDAKKLSVCRKIAQYLTNQESQMSRFEAVGWGPSNAIASQSEKVLAQPGLKALFDQSKYAQEQGICPGSWWSNVSTLAGQIKPDTTDAQFTEYLKIYDSNLDGLLDD